MPGTVNRQPVNETRADSIYRQIIERLFALVTRRASIQLPVTFMGCAFFKVSSSPENFRAKRREFALADATTPVTIMEELKKIQESIRSHRINLIKIL